MSQHPISAPKTVQNIPSKPIGPPKWLETDNVFLFVPNLIGYFRIVLAGAALSYMPRHPLTCAILYGISCILDALDGFYARKFAQSTKFGAVLDMVTDRCTTACLLVFLSSAYPTWAPLWQSLVSLDLASHYMHMYAMMERGAGSHKSVNRRQSWLLNLYYTNKTVLFVVCAMNEICFVAIYLQSFPSPSAARDRLEPFITITAWVCAPVCIGKQIISVVQLVRACQSLGEMDTDARKAVAEKAT